MKYTPDFCSRFRILKGGKISLVVSALVAGSTMTFASPTGGQVTSGSAAIAQNGSITTINQSSNKASINWNSFSIAPSETVNFVQPSASSVTLNRVVGTTQSLIQGAMNANGQVFLLNPNGVLFANGSQINVGGLVASTLNITDENFQSGNYLFEGNSQNSIINMGTITANNGYVAMMGKTVQNEGTIVATMGNVQMASGEKISLNLNGNSLVKLTIDQGILNALVENKGLIQADGGQVYLTTQALNTILDGMVNNTGVIEAKTLNDVTGKVVLFAHGGTANIAGILDASAPVSGDGGFIETSGNIVNTDVTLNVTTKANNGKIGTWLIDPLTYTIAASGGNETGAALATRLAATNIEIQADNTVTVNDAVSWSANKLTLNSGGDILINANLTASGSATLALYYGQVVADGGTSRYTVANAVDILIPTASAFTWKKGSVGIVKNLVFDNGNLRFGGGTDASINDYGLLLQPWYYDNVTTGRNDWYKLTYTSNPLDIALGVGGVGSEWNTNGTISYTDAGSNQNFVSTNFNINIAKYFEGTGTVSANNTYTFADVGSILVSNKYTLLADASYLKAITSVSNVSGTDTTNVRLWVGTRDDWVVAQDSNYKTKGNLDATGFVTITDASTTAKAIIISENALTSADGAAILFYSTTEGANTLFNGFGDFNAQIVQKDPLTSAISAYHDGSYGLFMSLGNLANAQSGSITWYYAAAPVSQINAAINQVAGSAGVIPTPEPVVPAPAPTNTEVEKQVNNVITTIVNSTNTNPVSQVTLIQPTFAPVRATLTLAQTQTQNALQTLMPSSGGESFSIVGSASGAEPVKTLSMKEIQMAMGADKEIRVPLGNGSLIELVSGGLNLPSGVSQEFYVVDNNNKKSKKN